MILFKNDFKVTTKTIRGVQYVVFSMYENTDTVYDKVSKQIQKDFDNCLEKDTKV